MNLHEIKIKIKGYEKHGDLVLINEETLKKQSLLSDDDRVSEELTELLCRSLKCNRLGIKRRISADDFRSPQVQLIKGEDPWVTHIDNGIRYSFDVTKSMFSQGNIKEKLRVSKLNCHDEVIVDLFAGIGYFTLPLVVHAKAKLVHACEWNPDAVLALNKNLIQNKVENKCIVHVGDNRVVCPVNVADRVYMGLIPTSLQSLEAACRALRPDSSKCILHVHENVSHFGAKSKVEINAVLDNWAKETASKVLHIMSSVHTLCKWNVQVLQINKVKRYAPHIDHLVVDLKCTQIYS